MNASLTTIAANGYVLDDWVRGWIYKRVARGMSWDDAMTGVYMDSGLYANPASCRRNMHKFADRMGLAWPPSMEDRDV